MAGDRNQEIFGIFLAVLGTLFLLVNNHVLWFGWEALWPTIPFILGLFLLRVYTRRRSPRQLVLGSFLVQFGFFFSLFSTGLVPWGAMEGLWPAIPLMIGISLLILSVAGPHGAPPLVFGLVLVIFAVVGFLAESDLIGSRLSEPFVRVWPLALVAAGVLIYSRARRERLEPGSSAPADTAGSSPPEEPPP